MTAKEALELSNNSELVSILADIKTAAFHGNKRIDGRVITQSETVKCLKELGYWVHTERASTELHAEMKFIIDWSKPTECE